MKSPDRNKGSTEIAAFHRVSVFCSWYKPRENTQSYSQDTSCSDCTGKFSAESERAEKLNGFKFFATFHSGVRSF
jgi:hypothetical protein